MNLLLGYKAAIIIGWFAVMFIAERLYRAAPYPVQFTPAKIWSRLGNNFCLSAINFFLSPLIILPLTVYFANSFNSWRPEWMRHGGFILLDLILIDFFLYWWHRANHRVPLLWRFHQVHHLDEFLDTTSALRFHFGEVLLSAMARVLFIAMLAIPISSIIIAETLLMICTIFHHSNLKLPAKIEGILRWVVVTPAIHWVHHHPKHRDTNSNYAAILNVWDKLFHTRNKKLRWQAMAIGVEKRHELPLPRLLIEPIKQNSAN